MKDAEKLYYYISGSIESLEFFMAESHQSFKTNDLVVYPELLKAAKVNMISLLLLSIKEDLITDNFDTLVLDHDLKDAVDQIRNKTALLKNTTLNSDAEIISLIRNKLAHGEFVIDFKGNKVSIMVNGEALIININALAIFSALLAKAYLRCINNDAYNKTVFNVNLYKTERIETEYDIIKLLENVDEIVISLKERNGNKISSIVYEYVNSAIKLINTTKDIRILKRCQEIITKNYPEYEFSYTIKKLSLTKEQKKTFADNMLHLISPDILSDNETKVNVIMLELHNYINQEKMTYNALNGAVVALELLDVIKKTQSVSTDVINNFISEKYAKPLLVNENVFVASLLGVFQAMFAYSKDNFLKDMDYSSYNFDLIKPTVINVGGEKQSLQVQLDAINNRLVDLCAKYVEGCKQRDKINKDNVKGLTCINNNLNNCLIYIYNENCLRKTVSDRIQELEDAKFQKHEYNKTIVEGIRNSIAHGNYEVISGNSLESCLIKFQDIYEGEVTFSATISFADFRELLMNNCRVLIEYLDKQEETYKDNANIL
ncbi:MAG: hypothetical protein J5892_04795 [Bacilli bacterium]|nr:hypothetical protein [Bacilli bacterium]